MKIYVKTGNDIIGPLLKLGFPQVVNWKFLSTSSHS
jgi:hypothetical protein